MTKGGVDLKEINPKTLESKKVPGLHFAGESWTSTPTPVALTLPTALRLAGWLVVPTLHKSSSDVVDSLMSVKLSGALQPATRNKGTAFYLHLML